MSLNSILTNYYCKKSDDKRDAGLTTPDDILRNDNILYGTDKKRHTLDVYRPKKYEGKLPVIVNVHGGGWVYGTTKTYQFYCMNLAQKGFAVVSFNYRLAPKFKYPCAIEDVNSAFSWVMSNADKYDLDTSNLFAVGDSAGGQLLAQYACIATNNEYAAGFDFKVPDNLKFNAIALNCGVYHIDKPQENKAIIDYLPKKRFDELLEEITIVGHITDKFPPAFVMTSNEDFLREEPGLIVPVFEEKGIEYISKKYGDEEHHLLHVFHVNIRSEEATVCNDEECDFFKAHIV